MVASDTGPASYNRYVRIILTSTHVNSVLDSVLIRAVPSFTFLCRSEFENTAMFSAQP